MLYSQPSQENLRHLTREVEDSLWFELLSSNPDSNNYPATIRVSNLSFRTGSTTLSYYSTKNQWTAIITPASSLQRATNIALSTQFTRPFSTKAASIWRPYYLPGRSCRASDPNSYAPEPYFLHDTARKLIDVPITLVFETTHHPQYNIDSIHRFLASSRYILLWTLWLPSSAW